MFVICAVYTTPEYTECFSKNKNQNQEQKQNEIT